MIKPLTWNYLVQCTKHTIVLALFFFTPLSYAQEIYETPPLKIEWVLPAKQASEAREEIKFSTDQMKGDTRSESDSKGLPLLYVLAGLVALPDLIDGLISVYKDYKYGTTIIQCTTKNECRIDHDPKGKGDTVVIKNATGTDVQIYQDRKDLNQKSWTEIFTKIATTQK